MSKQQLLSMINKSSKHKGKEHYQLFKNEHLNVNSRKDSLTDQQAHSDKPVSSSPMKRRIRNKFSAYSKQDSAEFRFEQNTMYSPFRKINSNLENLETQKSVLYTDQQQYDSVGLKSKMPYLNLEEDSKADETNPA